MSEIMCSCCRLDTAGQHEYNCPMRPKGIGQELKDDTAEFRKMAEEMLSCQYLSGIGFVISRKHLREALALIDQLQAQVKGLNQLLKQVTEIGDVARSMRVEKIEQSIKE